MPTRRAGAEDRGTRARRAPRSSSTTARSERPRGDRRADRRRDAARPSCRASTIPYIVAGQGSVGLEILEQLGRDAAGGSSCRAAAAGLPRASRWPARCARSSSSSPRAGTTWARSLRGGRDRAGRGRAPPTLCDALQTPLVSPITFGVLQRARARRRSASARPRSSEAMRWAWREHELVVEPGGAVALAAVLAGKVELVDGSGGRSCRAAISIRRCTRGSSA